MESTDILIAEQQVKSEDIELSKYIELGSIDPSPNWIEKVNLHLQFNL